MNDNLNSSRPISIKLALVSAAIGAGFAAPAQAAVVSTAPAGFTPITFTTTSASYAIDLDGNGVTDFTIQPGQMLEFGTFQNTDMVTLVGASSTNQTDSSFAAANGYSDPSHFLSANGIKGAQTASLSNSGLSTSSPYAELIFAGENDALTRGYLEGYVTNPGSDASFTLVDFGLAPEAHVPEPGSLALLAAGAAGMGALRRRRKARAL